MIVPMPMRAVGMLGLFLAASACSDDSPASSSAPPASVPGTPPPTPGTPPVGAEPPSATPPATAAEASILPGTASAWKLEFEDAFDGTSIDDAKWTKTIDPYGDQSLAGNSELECYLPANFEFGGGLTKIVAKKEDVTCGKPSFAAHYTSGALISADKFSLSYGYFELRAKLTKGKGLWPAFWLMPQNKTWPPEIDIFEFINTATTTVYQTFHYKDTNGAHQTIGSSQTMADASADFHVYGLSKSPGKLVWYIDGKATKTVTEHVFDGAVYILLNLAVGGTWPGSPDASTPFPATLSLDWVRAYSCSDWTQCG